MNFAKAVQLTMGTGLAIQFLSALSGVLLARTVGPEGRGLYGAALVYPLLISGIVGLGFAPYLARIAAQKNPDICVPTLLVEAITLAGVQVTLGLVLITISYHLGFPADPTAGYLAFWFGSLWIPLNQLILMLTSVDQGREHWRRYNATRFVIFPSNFLLLAGLWALGQLTVSNALLAMILANLVAVLVRIRKLTKEMQWRWIGFTRLREAFVGALPYATISVTTICVSQADTFLATTLMTHQNAGYYLVALAVAQLLGPISRSVGQVVFTHSARAPNSSSAANSESILFAKRLIVFAITFGLVASGIAIVLPFLIVFVYGAQFQDAVSIAYLMLPGGFAIATATIFEEHLKGVGRPAIVTRTLWLTLVIFVPAGTYLIQHFGVHGLAIGFSVAQSVRLLVILIATNRVEKVDWLCALRSLRKF